MELFGMLKKNKDKPKDSYLTTLSLEHSNWNEVFSACLGKMMAIQTACGELVVKDQNWNVDFSEGTIAFGSDQYPLQFLGSEAKNSNTWLWGWENINGFTDTLLTAANHAKQQGERWGLAPLTTAKLAIDEVLNGHNLSIVTCAMLEHACYYRGPHDGGAIFVAFSGVPHAVFAPVDALKFISLTSQCISQFQINHKLFVEGFLRWNHTSYQWNGQTLVAEFSQPLTIVFEQAGDNLRIASMNGMPTA